MVGKKGIEKRAKHIALWSNRVHYGGGGGVVVKPNRLWSVGKKVQGPKTKRGTDAKASELENTLDGLTVEAELKS